MTISIQQVKKVAKLARLSPTEAELERYQHELSAILDYVDRLQELDTTGVAPLANPVEETNRLRADEPQPGLAKGVLSDLAPMTSGPFVTVPKIIGNSEE
jgi:aspartyl-tRNA(Asn)/glutamyl-tRNA(Gln) amidotransferase subunit C